MLYLTIFMLVAFFASGVISTNVIVNDYSCHFEEDLCRFEPAYVGRAGMDRVKLNDNYVMLAKGTSAVDQWFCGIHDEACLVINYNVLQGSLKQHYVWIRNAKTDKCNLMSLSKTAGWKTASFNITSKDYFQVELFVVADSPYPLVAYDDICITYGPCR